MTHQCHRTPLPFRSLRQALEVVGLNTDVLPLWRGSLNQRAPSPVYTSPLSETAGSQHFCFQGIQSRKETLEVKQELNLFSGSCGFYLHCVSETKRIRCNVLQSQERQR